MERLIEVNSYEEVIAAIHNGYCAMISKEYTDSQNTGRSDKGAEERMNARERKRRTRRIENLSARAKNER